MSDTESILLTTLLDPLERSIFHDSEEDEEETQEEIELFHENDEEKHFGLDDSIRKVHVSLDKENMRPRNSPALKKSFLSNSSRRNTPLRNIGNKMKNPRDSDSHSKVASKFLELGARIHSLLEDSIISTTLSPKNIVQEEERGEEKVKVKEDEDAEIVRIISQSKTSSISSSPVRIADPVSLTLSSDLQSMIKERYIYGNNDTISRPRVVIPESRNSKNVVLHLKKAEESSLIGSERAAFLKIRAESCEKKQEEKQNTLLSNMMTPQSVTTSTTMVLWNSSPELKFSPGNSTLQDQSLEHLKRKFLMRTERRRRRRKAIRKMLSMPNILEASAAATSSSSSSPTHRSVSADSRSSSPSSLPSPKEEISSPPPSQIKGSQALLKYDDVGCSSLINKSSKNVVESSRIVESSKNVVESFKKVENDSWRDVIRRSVTTMQKLDKIFNQKKEEKKIKKSVPSMCLKSKDNEMSKKVVVAVKQEEEEEEMRKTDAHRRVKTMKRTHHESTKIFSNKKVQERWWDNTNDHASSSVSTMTALDLFLSSNVHVERKQGETMKKDTHQPTAAESSIDMSSLIVVDDDDEKEILAPLPSEMSFRVGHSMDCGMLNTGTVEVVPLDIRSNCVSSLLRVEMRITPRRDAPRALLEHLRHHWNFSFAIEDETAMKTDRSQPLTCRSDTGSDDWYGSDVMFQNVNGENNSVPMCRAIELHLRPSSMTRIRVSLTQSHNINTNDVLMPPVVCPAMITVKARRIGSKPGSSLFRGTIPLYLRTKEDKTPALLTNGEAISIDENKNIVRLRFAKKLSPIFECTCNKMFSESRVFASSKKTCVENLFMGESESGRWFWQFVSLDTKESFVKLSAKIRATQSTKSSKCRWIIKPIEAENRARSESSLKTDIVRTGFKFAVGFCAINSPIVFRTGKRSRHDAKLVVHVNSSDGKRKRAFRFKLSANTRGTIRIQVPKVLSESDAALVLRCVPGGYVRRIVPIRNTGTVPVTMRTEVLSESKDDTFTVWPQSVCLLPGEACACTVRFSAVSALGSSEYSARLLVVVPGASYRIPLRGEASSY